MKLRRILPGLVVLLFACKTSHEPDVLPKERMVPILYAMMIADEVAVLEALKDSTRDLKTHRADRYQQVFSLYNTDRKAFWSSFKYYEGHPAEFKTILDSIDAEAVRNRTRQYLK